MFMARRSRAAARCLDATSLARATFCLFLSESIHKRKKGQEPARSSQKLSEFFVHTESLESHRLVLLPLRIPRARRFEIRCQEFITCGSSLHFLGCLLSGDSTHGVHGVNNTVKAQRQIGTQMRHLLTDYSTSNAHSASHPSPHVRQLYGRVHLVLRHASGRILILTPSARNGVSSRHQAKERIS